MLLTIAYPLASSWHLVLMRKPLTTPALLKNRLIQNARIKVYDELSDEMIRIAEEKGGKSVCQRVLKCFKENFPCTIFIPAPAT